MSLVKQSSKVVLFGGAPVHNFMAGQDRKNRWHNDSQPTANIVFVDGHVKYHTIEEGDGNECDKYSWLVN